MHWGRSVQQPTAQHEPVIPLAEHPNIANGMYGNVYIYTYIHIFLVICMYTHLWHPRKTHTLAFHRLQRTRPNRILWPGFQQSQAAHAGVWARKVVGKHGSPTMMSLTNQFSMFCTARTRCQTNKYPSKSNYPGKYPIYFLTNQHCDCSKYTTTMVRS